MPDMPANSGEACDEFHVVGVYFDKDRDGHRYVHPLLILRCSPVEAIVLADTIAAAEPTDAGRPRRIRMTRWSTMSEIARAAARLVAGRYAEACAAVDAAGVPWFGGDDADDAKREEAASRAGLRGPLFGLHLTARRIALGAGRVIDDGGDAAILPTATGIAVAVPDTVGGSPPRTELRALAGEPGRFADDGDVATFSSSAGAMPVEPASVDAVLVPIGVLAAGGEAADADEPCQYGFYLTVVMAGDDDENFLASPSHYCLARSPVRSVMARLAGVVRHACGNAIARGELVTVTIVRGDALSDAERFLLRDRFGDEPSAVASNAWLPDGVGDRLAGWLERMERDARRADEDYAGECEAERDAAASVAEDRAAQRRADPIGVIDDAAEALRQLCGVILAKRNRVGGDAAIAEAHRAFAVAAGDVFALHDPGPIDPSLRRLPALWRAAGAAGQRCGDTDDGWTAREAAGDELADLRRDVLIGHERDRAAMAAQSTLPGVVTLTPAAIAEAVASMSDEDLRATSAALASMGERCRSTLAGLVRSLNEEGRRVLAGVSAEFGVPRSVAGAGADGRPDPAERDAPAAGSRPQVETDREHAAKIKAAAEYRAGHPSAGKEEVARAAGFNEKYFTRGRGAQAWDAIVASAPAIRRGWRRRDDSGKPTGDVDAADDDALHDESDEAA